MNNELNREHISHMLFDIFSVRAERQTAQSGIPVLLFLRAMRPTSIDIVIVLAWELLKEHRFTEAKSILEIAEFERPDNASIKAALASVLYFTGDDSWRGYLAEIHRLPHTEEASIVAAALEAAASSDLEPASSLAVFQNRSRFVRVMEVKHPQLMTK